MQVVSSNQVRVHKTSQSGGNYPSVWAFEPGPLKVVAIDTGGGLVDINPEGGVVVAVVKAEVTIQDNEGLYIYQSTKQVKVEGSGFENLDVSWFHGAFDQRVMTGLPAKRGYRT